MLGGHFDRQISVRTSCTNATSLDVLPRPATSWRLRLSDPTMDELNEVCFELVARRSQYCRRCPQ